MTSVPVETPISRRRLLAAGAAFAAMAGPLRAGIGPAPPAIGVLHWEGPEAIDRIQTFRRTLGALGYIDGTSIVIHYRFAAEDEDRARILAKELARLPAAILVGFATPAARAIRRAAGSIPVVVSAADPLAAGLVSSLSRPGGNVTGVSAMLPGIAAKRLELLRDLIPAIRTVALISSTRTSDAEAFRDETAAAARSAGIDILEEAMPDLKGADALFRTLSDVQVDAAIVHHALVRTEPAARIVAGSARRYRVPTISDSPFYARVGGLITLGPSSDAAIIAAASCVDRILRGERTSEMPIIQPSVFDLALNLGTARVLGLAAPPAVMALANIVVE